MAGPLDHDGANDRGTAGRSSEAALALLPGLSYLAREAREAGLDTVHDLITEALSGVLQWIEEEAHDRRRPQDCH